MSTILLWLTFNSSSDIKQLTKLISTSSLCAKLNFNNFVDFVNIDDWIDFILLLSAHKFYNYVSEIGVLSKMMVRSLLTLVCCCLVTDVLGLLGFITLISSISGCCLSLVFIALLNDRYFIFSIMFHGLLGFYSNWESAQSTSYYYPVQQADSANYIQGVTHASQASIPDFLYFWYD